MPVVKKAGVYRKQAVKKAKVVSRKLPPKKVPAPKDKRVLVIEPPNMQTAKIRIRGTAPLVMNAFPKSALEKMRRTMELGSKSKTKKNREPRDFDKNFEEAKHLSEEGWYGIPTKAFRAAMVSACKNANFVMTKAKLAIFILPDGIDRREGVPLVRIISKKEPERHECVGRNTNKSADIRVRPMWRQWEAVLHLQWDADVFSATDIVNLLTRVGMTVGVLEGRHDSKQSVGLGWGTFELINR